MALAIGTHEELPLPVTLTVEHVPNIRIQVEGIQPDAELQPELLGSVAEPVSRAAADMLVRSLHDLGDAPSTEALTRWFEAVLALQRSAVGSAEVFEQAARAVVELVGLDVGMVLLLHEGAWTVAARHAPRPGDEEIRFSRTLVDFVSGRRRTFYEDLEKMPRRVASLQAVSAAVVSPIFGLKDEVAGLIYGVRRRGMWKSKIRPIEAQLLQLLAAAVGSQMARSAALRTRVQFEQFFTADLVRELERNPALLEGRDQEVTILVSDLRGYTSISQRLGAQTSCRLVRDMMERLSQQIGDHGGVIVDYAGDGILAMWNAPAAQPDHAARACRAALAMQGEMPALNAVWESVVGNPLVLGIGINSGMAQVGNTGSSRKFKYGPHGHTVNLASQVQDATKKLMVPILLTTATRDQLPAHFVTAEAGTVQLADVAEPVVLHALQQDG